MHTCACFSIPRPLEDPTEINERPIAAEVMEPFLCAEGSVRAAWSETLP